MLPVVYLPVDYVNTLQTLFETRAFLAWPDMLCDATPQQTFQAGCGRAGTSQNVPERDRHRYRTLREGFVGCLARVTSRASKTAEAKAGQREAYSRTWEGS
jgi:hypothetical protein